MSKRLDLTGKQYGELIVLGPAELSATGRTRWQCECSCGAQTIVQSSNLRKGGTTTCGRWHKTRSNGVGSVFGLLTVVELLGSQVVHSHNQLVVRCKCECGGEWLGPISRLRRGGTRSCGCLRTGPKPITDRTWPARRRVLTGYKQSAKRRGLVWELGYDEFCVLVASKCHYCGAKPSNICKVKAGSIFTYNGIDRKDNDVGYTLANVVPCCAQCNYAKRDVNYSDFLHHVSVIHNYNRS